MKLTDVVQFLERLAEKTSKKSVLDDERIVAEWTSSGALLLHLDVSGLPKIKRYARLNFDASTTAAEKKTAFSQFLSVFPDKQRPKAVLTWSDGMVFRQLSLPDMPREDLLKALDWELKKKFYFNPQENLMGFKAVMSVEGEEASGKLYSVLYCDNKTALPRLDFVYGLGLEVLALVPGQASLAAFAASTEQVPDKDVLVCDLEEGSIRILVARENNPMLVRNVTVTTPDGIWSDEALGRAAEEVKKTIDFYEAQKYARTVGRVIFAGERCEPVRILDFMTSRITVPVSVPQMEKFLSGSLEETDKKAALENPALFASAMGAVLSRDETFNLVPSDVKVKNRFKKTQRLLNLGLVGLAVFLSLITSLSALQLNLVRGRIATLHKESEKLNQNKKVLDDLLIRSRVRRTTLKGDVPMYALLKDVSLRTPGAITFRQLSFIRPDNSFKISGEIIDSRRETSKIVQQFSQSLSESPFFSTSAVTRSDQDPDNKITTFDISTTTKGLSV